MRIYLANKMCGIPFFNAPWFDMAAEQLRHLPGVEAVFNPADHDREHGFEPMRCVSGTFEEAARYGFELSNALVADWTWIGTQADCVVLGPDWTDSKGAISEAACIQGLRKPAYEYAPFMKYYGTSELIKYILPPIMELGGPVVVAGDGMTDGHRGVGWI